ncbi:unnamed protein product [Heterobilharzia americana]|nr:unnamed protein product [Heterobilharzia americana]
MKSNQLCMTRLSDRLLPIHPNNLNKVMHSEWESISQWLYDVLSSGDILCEISAVFTSIRRFITIFGMRLPKTQRIALVRLVIAYICCPNIDTKVIFSALQLLKCLMTKPYSLPSSSLSVDWKIFWDMERWIESELEASDGCIVWPEEERKAFCDCLALCTKFFPKSSIEEIWLRIRHNICSYLANESTCLSLYPFFTYTPFYPKHFDEISRVWLPDIFDLWYIHSDSGEHPEFIEILCKVSQIGRGRIDWEPHIERIFSGFLRRITLKYCQSSVIYRLEQSFKAMESFYHPSSEQKESAKLLTCFISKFLRCLISRLRDELFPPVEALDLGYAPPEFYLSVEQIDQIVNLFTPICLKYLLYSKVDLIVNTAVKIISMLSKLRPSIVIPYLLNDLEYGLIKPEMPLRFTRPLYALSLSVQSLIYVRFPLYPRGCFSAYHFDEEDSDRYDDDDDDIVVEDDMTIDTTNVKDDSENESVEEEEDLLSSDADDEFSGKLKHIKLQDDNKLNDKSRISSLHHSKHGVKKKIFRKSSYTPAYTHVSPSVRNGHLKAFTYLAGRAELNRVLQILLHGLDMNDLDRLNYTIACLSRIFLSTPILTFSIDDNNNEYINPITKKIINESIEVQDTIFIIYERILSFLTKLNETTNLDIQNNINISFSTTYRPYAKPIDNSRSPLDICQMSELTGLCIAIAISISSNLHLKYRLIKHLTNIIFTYQWALDISRLLGYQAYWFAVDSLSTNITNNSSINLLQCKDNLPSSIYSIKLIWPKFISIIKEIENAIENDIIEKENYPLDGTKLSFSNIRHDND